MPVLRLADTVSIAEDENGAVLLESRSGTLFGLSPTAAVFCAAVAQGRDHDMAVQAVLDAFEVDEATARADLAALIDELLAHHLVIEASS